jgi:hypothetical protein
VPTLWAAEHPERRAELVRNFHMHIIDLLYDEFEVEI